MRAFASSQHTDRVAHQHLSVCCELRWAVKDSNLRRLLPTDLQSVPVGHLGNRPSFFSTHSVAGSRSRPIGFSPDRQPSTEADDGNRTRNLPLTRRLLCRLSYVGNKLIKFLRKGEWHYTRGVTLRQGILCVALSIVSGIKAPKSRRRSLSAIIRIVNSWLVLVQMVPDRLRKSDPTG